MVVSHFSAMPHIRQLVNKLAPERIRLAWSRRAIQRGYGKTISAARTAKKFNEVADLEGAMRFEMDLQRELEDSYLTTRLLQQARRLRVPIPYHRNPDGSESDHWYEGSQTGEWYLSTNGIRSLRQEIRQELKDRHESRSHYLIWLTALTGVIGSITGLIAVMQ
jgi:adenylate kinase family enzyme